MDKNIPTENQGFDLLASIIGFFRSIRNAIIALFKGIIAAIYWIFRKIIRYFFCFIVILASCLFWGFYTQKSMSQYYQGDAMVYCNGFDSFTLNEEVRKLNDAIRSNNTVYLTNALGIEAEYCAKLMNIEMATLVDNDDDGLPNIVKFDKKFAPDEYLKPEILKTKEEGDVRVKTPKSVKIPEMAVLRISVNTTSIDEFKAVAKGVLRFFNAEETLVSLFHIYKETVDFGYQTAQNQIAMLDSLQKIEYLENARKQNVSSSRDLYLAALMSSNNNLTTKDAEKISRRQGVFHEDILELLEQRNDYRKKSEMAQSPLTVISDFSPALVSISKSWLPLTILLSLIIHAALASILDYRKQIWQYIKEQRN